MPQVPHICSKNIQVPPSEGEGGKDYPILSHQTAGPHGKAYRFFPMAVGSMTFFEMLQLVKVNEKTVQRANKKSLHRSNYESLWGPDGLLNTQLLSEKYKLDGYKWKATETYVHHCKKYPPMLCQQSQLHLVTARNCGKNGRDSSRSEEITQTDSSNIKIFSNSKDIPTQIHRDSETRTPLSGHLKSHLENLFYF